MCSKLHFKHIPVCKIKPARSYCYTPIRMAGSEKIDEARGGRGCEEVELSYAAGGVQNGAQTLESSLSVTFLIPPYDQLSSPGTSPRRMKDLCTNIHSSFIWKRPKL